MDTPLPMRANIDASLKAAMKAKDKEKNKRRISTLRLINAAIKDRDIAARQHQSGGISDQEIIELLARMIKQRKESQRIYEEAGRLELSRQEQEEIAIISEFLPKQMSDEEIQEACASIVRETGASGLKDMGRVMGALKSRYAGQMDFGVAGSHIKKLLKEAS